MTDSRAFCWPQGVMTALVTPMRGDALDLDTLRRVIDRQVEDGVAGLVVAGGTGEYGTLSLEEREQLAVESVRLAAGRLPVILQTGALATRDAIRLSVHAQEAGADAIMVASPYGETISWPERLRFYEQLTAQVSLPVMVYNTPPSGLLTFEQALALAELPHVEAIKDSSGSPELMGDLVTWAAEPGHDLAVYVGLDSLLYDAVATGADGAIFGAANLIPAPLSAVARSVREEGPKPESRELWRHIRAMLRAMEVSPNYVSLCKAGMELVGIGVGEARPPYLMPEKWETERLAGLVEDVEAAYAASPLHPR